MISPSHSSRSSSSERAENQHRHTPGHPPHITDTRSTYALLSGGGGAYSSGQPVLYESDENGEETSIFPGMWNNKGKKKRQAADMADEQSEKGKAAKIAYHKTEKGRVTRSAYRKSEKGKAIQAAYSRSAGGKAKQLAYSHSEKGKAVCRTYREKMKAIVAWANKNGWPGYSITKLNHPAGYPDGKALAERIRAAYAAAHSKPPTVSASQPELSLSLSPSQARGAIPSEQNPNIASISQPNIAAAFDDQLDIDIANLLADNTTPAGQHPDIASPSQVHILDAFDDILDIENSTEASLTNVTHAFDGLVDIEGDQATVSDTQTHSSLTAEPASVLAATGQHTGVASALQTGISASVDDLASLDIDNLAADAATPSNTPTVSTPQAEL